MKSCEVFLSLSELEKLRSTKGTQRTEIARFIDSLRSDPYYKGDATTTDATGRVLQIKVLGRYAVIFWHDSPVSEIKVTGIIPTA